MSELLTPRETARLLKVTVGALRRFRQEQRGPAFTRVGKLIRYRSEDLDRWLSRQVIAPEGEAVRG
jgi:excisionase family DNA binding protein